MKHIFLCVLLGICQNSVAADRPNVVILLADDCTYLDMEAYGGQAKTPHLCRLQREGMTFRRCFQAAPMCSPTRHNLYTGIYPVKSGAWPNHTRVYPGTKSIAHYLKDAGYRVALSGKTHIAPAESFPFEYSGEFRSADPKDENPYPKLRKLLRESAKNGTPFCAIACSNEPHSPWNRGDASAYSPDSLTLPPSWVDTPETREQYSRYLAEITFFDQQCGRLLKMLDEFNLRENTVVIALSEQGSSFPFAKWTCFELGLASGMIVRWPGTVAAASESNALVEYCDVTPTILNAAGLPKAETMDGRSFLQVLTGDSVEHKEYTYGLHTTRGIINGSEYFGIRSCGTKQFRYIRNLHPEITFTNAVTRTNQKDDRLWASWLKAAENSDRAASLVKRYQHRDGEELYNVAQDPHCLNNLIKDENLAGIRDELSTELDRWMASQGDTGHDIEASAESRQKRARKKGRSVKPNKSGNAKSK